MRYAHLLPTHMRERHGSAHERIRAGGTTAFSEAWSALCAGPVHAQAAVHHGNRSSRLRGNAAGE